VYFSGITGCQNRLKMIIIAVDGCVCVCCECVSMCVCIPISSNVLLASSQLDDSHFAPENCCVVLDRVVVCVVVVGRW